MQDTPADAVRTDLGPFAIMPRWIFTEATLDGKALRVLGYLASYADRDGTHCWPAQRTIAAALGISVDTVQRAIAVLVDHGLVVVSPRVVNGRKVGNNYLIRFLSESRRAAVSGNGPEAADLRPTEAAPVAVSYDQTIDQTNVPHREDARAGDAAPVSEEEQAFRTIIERIVDLRVAGTKPKFPANYRAAVRKELLDSAGERLRGVIAKHPGAPIEMFAAYAAGEPTPYLGTYRIDA